MQLTRFIYFQRPNDRIKLPELVQSTQDKVSGAKALEINGERRDIHDQVNVVIGRIKEANNSATTDLTAKVELDWSLPKTTAAIWDYSTRTIVLNPATALTHPQDLPFIVTHEAAHGGLLKVTNGKEIKAESVADLIAEMETGKRLSDAYDNDVVALKQICRLLDDQAQQQGYSSGEHYLIDIYSRNDLTTLFKTMLSATAMDNKAVNNAISLFKTAFPTAKVSYSGEHLGSRDTHNAVNRTMEQEQ